MQSPENPDRRPLVLVVDDDMTLRYLMRESLEQSGFLVSEAEDGSRALERFSETSPDIVLMDVEMPKMNGFQLCRALGLCRTGIVVPDQSTVGACDHSGGGGSVYGLGVVRQCQRRDPADVSRPPPRSVAANRCGGFNYFG